MAEILTPGCAEVKIRGTFGGRDWIMGMHAQAFLSESPIPLTDLSDLLAAVVTGSCITTALPAVLPTTAEISEVTVRDVGTAGAVSSSLVVESAGTVSADCQNAACAAVAILSVGGAPGFRRPGRLFFPAVPDTFATDCIVTNAAIGLYQAATNDLIEDINGAASGAGNWTAVVRSLAFLGHPREEGITATIQTHAIRPRVATQVSRLRPRKRREKVGA